LIDRRGHSGFSVGTWLSEHKARANPQWKEPDGQPVLAVFSGPHCDVSPSGYEADKVVAVWNFAIVPVTGRFEAVEDRAALREIVH